MNNIINNNLSLIYDEIKIFSNYTTTNNNNGGNNNNKWKSIFIYIFVFSQLLYKNKF